MYKIYTAGPFSWQKRIKARADELVSLGYKMTGEWLTQEQQFTNSDNSTVQSNHTWEVCQLFSVRDIENIHKADTLILFEPGIPLERNTRIAEFGLALGWGKQCITIGPEDEATKDVISSIFVKLQKVPRNWENDQRDNFLGRIKPVVQYRTWDDFMRDILDPIRVEVCNGCGTEYRVRDCGCPCGSGYIFKTRDTNYTVLPPNDLAVTLKQASALRSNASTATAGSNR